MDWVELVAIENGQKLGHLLHHLMSNESETLFSLRCGLALNLWHSPRILQFVTFYIISALKETERNFFFHSHGNKPFEKVKIRTKKGIALKWIIHIFHYFSTFIYIITKIYSWAELSGLKHAWWHQKILYFQIENGVKAAWLPYPTKIECHQRTRMLVCLQQKKNGNVEKHPIVAIKKAFLAFLGDSLFDVNIWHLSLKMLNFTFLFPPHISQSGQQIEEKKNYEDILRWILMNFQKYIIASNV